MCYVDLSYSVRNLLTICVPGYLLRYHVWLTHWILEWFGRNFHSELSLILSGISNLSISTICILSFSFFCRHRALLCVLCVWAALVSCARTVVPSYNIVIALWTKPCGDDRHNLLWWSRMIEDDQWWWFMVMHGGWCMYDVEMIREWCMNALWWVDDAWVTGDA